MKAPPSRIPPSPCTASVPRPDRDLRRRLEAEAQVQLANLAAEIRELARKLGGLRSRLPLPTDLEKRLDGARPYDVATEIMATAESVEDALSSAADSLASAARATDESLAREFSQTAREPALPEEVRTFLENLVALLDRRGRTAWPCLHLSTRRRG